MTGQANENGDDNAGAGHGLSLHDLKLLLTRDRRHDGEGATPKCIAQLARQSLAWAEEAAQQLRAEGFIIASIKGPVFTRLDPARLIERQAYLSALTCLAAQRAITAKGESDSVKWATLLEPIGLSVQQRDPFRCVAAVDALLLAIFDRAGLSALRTLYRSRASQAVAYAWANGMNARQMAAIHLACTRLVDLLGRRDPRAARYAARLRETVSIKSLVDLDRFAA